MATINLAPGAQYLASIRRRRRFLISLSTAVFVVTALAWLGAYLYLQSVEGNIAATQTRLQNLETQLAALQPDIERIALFEGRLTALKLLLDNHISWVPFLTEIERLLPPPTVLTSLVVVSDQGVVEVAGTAPDIDQIAQALASLTAERQPAQLFNSGEIVNVQRVQGETAEGQPGAVTYRFAIKLFFDNQRLRVAAVPST